ncbi:MAG TPA: hypothetical protein VFV46_02615 [Lacibacter sp.]|nr:hypothetical protein [Lacibacter sp.]
MRLFLLCSGIFLYSNTIAQFVTTNIGPNGETLFNLGSSLINKIKPDDVEGSPLLSDEWSRGMIKLRNNKQVKDVLLQYNLERSILYFSKDSAARFEFAERILEFTFTAAMKDKQEAFVFRSNYPSNGKFNDLTFYRVVSEGSKFHFLKYCYKTIQENFGFDKNVKRSYLYKEEWFLYEVELKTFHPVSNKKTIMAALPHYKEQIEALCEKNKWTLKSDEQVAQLVQAIK